MYMYIYIENMYIYVCIIMYIYVCTFMYIYIKCICIYIYISLYLNTYLCIYIYMYWYTRNHSRAIFSRWSSCFPRGWCPILCSRNFAHVSSTFIVYSPFSQIYFVKSYDNARASARKNSVLQSIQSNLFRKILW